MATTRRYELTDIEWERIKDLIPRDRTGKKGKPSKDNRLILNAIIRLARSGAPWRDLPEHFGPWETIYCSFRKWIDDGIIDNIFRILALDAELSELSLDSTIVLAHQHSAGAKKGDEKPKIGRSRGGLSTKINAVVDAYGYPVFFLLYEGQESNSYYAIEVLSHINIENSDVLADKGYDSDKIIDFVYENGGEPTIPPKANRTVQRKCNWLLYKERHLAECFFQKLKTYRRIVTRYDKLNCTFTGFDCISSICIWLNYTVAKSVATQLQSA